MDANAQETPPRGDRAVPCEEPSRVGGGSVAKVLPMVRLRSPSPTDQSKPPKVARQPWPEAYHVVRANWLELNIVKLRRMWANTPEPPLPPITFFDHRQGPYRSLSNFHEDAEWTFEIPEWCNQAGIEAADLPLAVPTSFAEKPIMVCKAALMNDWASFRLIIQAESPEQVKRLGRAVSPFNQALWDRRVCAVARAVVTQRVRANPSC